MGDERGGELRLVIAGRDPARFAEIPTRGPTRAPASVCPVGGATQPAAMGTATRAGMLVCMHLISGRRDPAASLPPTTTVDEVSERRQANRAVAVSAIGLTLTGLIELAIALVSGSVALLGDALHNLSDVSTSALVFIGF